MMYPEIVAQFEVAERPIGKLALSKLIVMPEIDPRETRYNQTIEGLMTEWMHFRGNWTDSEAKTWKRKIRGYTKIKLGLLLGSDIDWSLFDKIYGSEEE